MLSNRVLHGRRHDHGKGDSGLAEGAGHASITIDEAAKVLGCEARYVRTLRNRGKLKATPRKSELLTVASIKSYMEARKKVNHRTQEMVGTTEMETIA